VDALQGGFFPSVLGLSLSVEDGEVSLTWYMNQDVPESELADINRRVAQCGRDLSPALTVRQVFCSMSDRAREQTEDWILTPHPGF
jgi:hypothetical protein